MLLVQVFVPNFALSSRVLLYKMLSSSRCTCYTVNKVKFAPKHAVKAQMGSRGMALLLL